MVELFHEGNHGRVAFVVCGPTEIARDLRRVVGNCVTKSMIILFHDKKFG